MVKLILISLFLISCSKEQHVYKKQIPSETVKFCFIGDTGAGWKIQTDVSNMLLEEKCHSIHFLGDIIYPAGLAGDNDPQFESKFFNYYDQHTKKDNKPDLNLVMGNHDYRGAINYWRNIAKKHKKIVFPNPYYLLKVNNVCLVHIDTNYYGIFENYILGMKQAQWMNEIEPELKSCTSRIALTHHPLENKGEGHGSSSGLLRYFLEKYVVGKYDFLISGHEHVLADEGLKDKTRLLISGGGGKVPEGGDAGYLVMEVTTEKIDYTFRKMKSTK